jgi:hypothetical protein
MLRKDEGLFEDLTGHSSRRRSDGCGQAARSGGSDDLSSGESEFLCKRNLKKCGEWMRWQLMRLLTPFIGRRREGRQYREGETVVNDE